MPQKKFSQPGQQTQSDKSAKPDIRLTSKHYFILAICAIVFFISSVLLVSLSWAVLTLFVLALAAIVYFSLRNVKGLRRVGVAIALIIVFGYGLFWILLINSNM